MSRETLADQNAILANHRVAVSSGFSVGMEVASRLAARHGIRVRLSTGESGGADALVLLPKSLLVP